MAQEAPVPVVPTPFTTPEFQQYRPSWSVIPEVMRPAFNYGEVHNGKLIAEAGESLNYLSIDSLIVGNTRGYQVIGPEGDIFYLNNIENPTCAVQIVGQQLQTDEGEIVVQYPSSSSVYIGKINFDGCY